MLRQSCVPGVAAAKGLYLSERTSFQGSLSTGLWCLFVVLGPGCVCRVGQATLEFNTFLLALAVPVQELPKCLLLLIVYKKKTS